jgi:hypothetical protein
MWQHFSVGRGIYLAVVENGERSTIPSLWRVIESCLLWNRIQELGIVPQLALVCM